MKKYEINWLGRNYPAVDLTIFKDTIDELEVTVSTVELSDVLQRDMEAPVLSREATQLDESIAYYLESHEILMFSEEEIVKLIEKSYAV